ncbi:MAG TPA: hypothetical protein EYP90_06905, partial [Chromatiaceae bacterium]|nr:hypothetical protein [Chromatiaceae bacterium]
MTQYKDKKTSPNIGILNILSWLLAITVLFLVIARISYPIIAYDVWWHMLLGKQILGTGSLIPDHSIYTWMPADAYGVYNAWLAEVLLYITHQSGGNMGLLLIRYSIYSLFFLLAAGYAYQRRIFPHPLAWLIILVGLMISAPAFTVKPGLFTLGFMALTVWLYFTIRHSRNNAAWMPYLFPVILILWENSHGAFFIVALFFVAIIAGEILNVFFSPSQALPSNVRKHLFISLGLCIPALFINPFGYELPLHILNTVLGLAPPPDTRTKEFWPTFMFNDPPYYMLDYMIL